MKFYTIAALLVANIQCAPLFGIDFSNWGLFSPKTTSNNVSFNAGSNNINAGAATNNFGNLMQAMFPGNPPN
jgi:hypothetical protein